jgi:hypothetical protein
MLANQYFLTRKYEQAQSILDMLLAQQPDNLGVKKKLIICCTQTGHTDYAEKLFLEVLRENPFIIIDTDPRSEDCPCPELVKDMEQRFDATRPTVVELNQLGILYLYCDPKASLNCFCRSLNISCEQTRIREAVAILKKILEAPERL